METLVLVFQQVRPVRSSLATAVTVASDLQRWQAGGAVQVPGLRILLEGLKEPVCGDSPLGGDRVTDSPTARSASQDKTAEFAGSSTCIERLQASHSERLANGTTCGA